MSKTMSYTLEVTSAEPIFTGAMVDALKAVPGVTSAACTSFKVVRTKPADKK